MKQPSFSHSQSQRSSEFDLTPIAAAAANDPATQASAAAGRRASCPASHHNSTTALISGQQHGQQGGSLLGRLRCTVKYCFEKNALVVTINTCENLPAKDVANKSR